MRPYARRFFLFLFRVRGFGLLRSCFQGDGDLMAVPPFDAHQRRAAFSHQGPGDFPNV